jgi:hypothetical protein
MNSNRHATQRWAISRPKRVIFAQESALDARGLIAGASGHDVVVSPLEILAMLNAASHSSRPAKAETRLRAQRVSVAVALGLIVLAGGACGDSANRTGPDAGAESEHEHEHESTFEGCPESTPPFALGMQAVGELGRITGTLIDASNAPPLRYLNDWIVEFVDGEGQPLEDVSIRRARPFMPVHGHDGNVQPSVRQEQPGRFAVDGLNLNMRGPWEIQFQLRSPSAGDDYVVFHVCVDE